MAKLKCLRVIAARQIQPDQVVLCAGWRGAISGLHHWQADRLRWSWPNVSGDRGSCDLNHSSFACRWSLLPLEPTPRDRGISWRRSASWGI
eukprot:6178601-Pleurochrysis_carterae.AAC.1